MVLVVLRPEKREQTDGCTVDTKGSELGNQGGIGDDDLQQSDFGGGIDAGKENGCGDKSQQNTQIDINSSFNGLFDNDSQQDRIFK
jgi:hypothetical protein